MKIRSALAVFACLPAFLAASPATAASSSCSASGAVGAGWSGSRFAPVPPVGVGPSCEFQWSGLNDAVILEVHGMGSFGGQVLLTDGRRYFCRGALESALGQDRDAWPVRCENRLAFIANPANGIVGQSLRMTVPSELLPPDETSVYCSSTGEAGVLVDLSCHECFFFGEYCIEP